MGVLLTSQVRQVSNGSVILRPMQSVKVIGAFSFWMEKKAIKKNKSPPSLSLMCSLCARTILSRF